MLEYRRTHTCGELNQTHLGKTVRLSGWVHRRRDLGSFIFLDLRDRFGITQLIIDPKKTPEVHERALKLRQEWVITLQGVVIERAQGMANKKMSTGDIEIDVKSLDILSSALVPPFSIADDELEVSEELRLKYRYLDIRRGVIADNLRVRHKAMLSVRNYLNDHNFTEVTTPILAKSTPEGARDYLVPSRVHPGNFYALPQSPQLFKQLLMIGGMDRYFQIAACFRDEDLRADRQPEFTQIDIEMSFATPKELTSIVEGMIRKVFKDCIDKDISAHIEHMSYKDAVENYGCDKPDLRFDMPLKRIDDIAKETSFAIFQEQLQTGGCIKGLCVKNGSDISRKEIDRYTEFCKQLGAKGLVWIKKQAEGYSSSIIKFLSEETLGKIASRFEMEENDLIFLIADKENKTNQALDHLRRLLAKDRNLIDPEALRFLWVVDFPLFEWNEEEASISSVHHPFTSPHFEDIHLLDSAPLKVRSYAYDLILNGYEVGGGSQRIHNGDLQEKIFRLLNLSDDEIKNRFGFFVESLKYGTPPHLGIAFGLDRLVMILSGCNNIKDVIAFPKTQKASDLMMNCPSSVNDKQLNELKIKTTETKEISWI